MELKHMWFGGTDKVWREGKVLLIRRKRPALV